MIFSARVRKPVLVTHVACAVGWLGAAAAYVPLGITAAASGDVAVIRGTWSAMDLVGWTTIVPLAFGALVSGVVMALGTKWGLLRHYWVVFSLVLTTVAFAVLVVHMLGVTQIANAARTMSAADVLDLGGDIAHPVLGVVVLLAVQVLNTYKPRGLTPLGAQRASVAVGGGPHEGGAAALRGSRATAVDR